MAYGLGLLKGMWVTLRHTFEKKSLVVQYPEQRPHLQERFRGSLCFDFEKCTMCMLCSKGCPNNVLGLEIVKPEDGGKRKLMAYTMDMQYCMFCNLCVEACNFNALSWDHEFEKAKFVRDEIAVVYNRPDNLDAIEAAKEAAKAEKAAQAKAAKEAKEAKEAAEKPVAAVELPLMQLDRGVLLELSGSDENIALLGQALATNTSMHDKLLKMVDAGEMGKAQKVAAALLKQAAQSAPAATTPSATAEAAPDLALLQLPQEVLLTLAGSQENIAILAQSLRENPSMHDKLLAMVEENDLTKAQKVAAALIKKAAPEGGAK